MEFYLMNETYHYFNEDALNFGAKFDNPETI
jgi:hypothetical protein